MGSLEQIRSIDQSFANAFKSSSLYKLYKEHTDELFLGVRDGYVNLYHLCNSIAKVSLTRKGIKSEIAPYYIDKIPKNLYDNDLIVRMFETIKVRSRNRSKLEKQAQQTLALLNNSNPQSNWFCIDVEYEKPKMAGRFDLIAVSKDTPHRVALIELKYGTNAYGGGSGILTHVKDFSEFLKNNNYENLRKDIEGILSSFDLLNVTVPDSLKGLKAEDLCATPEFYFITVNSNPPKRGATSAKQTMAGYLFKEDNPKYSDWHCKRHSINAVEDILKYDITEKKSPFYATLLFSDQDIKSLKIDDIIDGEYSERITPCPCEINKRNKINMNELPEYTSEYKENERSRQMSLLGSKVLEGAKGHGYYFNKYGDKETCDYILKPEDSLKCIFPLIRTDVLKYFERYDISWWRQSEDRYFPSGHLISSQNHCLNHLFHIRKDPKAVLKIIQPLGEMAGVHFDKVLPLSFIDMHEAYFDNENQKAVKNSNYISFEFVCDNIRSIGETREKRGSKCTSVDAFIYAQAGDEKWLVPIEWKYTEVYSHDTGAGRDRYSKYLHPSSRLKGWAELYEKDPFYEFSRQTLLMENLIINKPLVGKTKKYPLQADNFLHIIVVPDGNIELLKDVETFRETIKPEMRNLFISIDPEKLISPLEYKYHELVSYLRDRYWNVTGE